MLSFQITAVAQLSYGASVPNFIINDLNGNPQDLHSYLNQGYGAILDFSATWCPPCWNYHQTGILENVWTTYGPPGSDEVMVFFIEPDPSTTQQCIYGPSGCSGGSIGDWTVGVDYPILNPSSSGANQVNNSFNISYYPTIYAVGPNFKVYETGQLSSSSWANWMESFKLQADYTLSGIACNDQQDIELVVEGGYNNISYQWSSGQTTQNIYNIEPGSYSVSISDSHNYTIVLGPIDVVASDPISLSLDDYEDISCFGANDGILEITADGGTGAYSYAWSNGANSSYVDNLSEGTYYVTVTDTNTNCTQQDQYYVFEPNPLTFNPTITTADCQGQGGGIKIIASGGTIPYTYWVDDNNYSNSNITGLAPGIYETRVVDYFGCEDVDMVEVPSSNVPVADTMTPPIFNCYLDSLVIHADSSSVASNISYFWYQDTMLIDTGYQVTLDTSGIFTLLVVDQISNCMDSIQFPVMSDMTNPEVNINASNLTIDCVNLQSDLSVSNLELNYQWLDENNNVFSDSIIASIDQGGTYNLIGTDTINGCMTIDTILIESNQVEPELALVDIQDIDCNQQEGLISIAVAEDAAISWSTDDGIIITDGDGLEVVVGSSGNYNVEVTDPTNGCITQSLYTVESSTALPNIAFEEPQTLSCANSIVSIAANYSEDYTYQWYSVDNAIIPNANSNTVEVESPGIYILEVIDLTNNCTKSQSIMVEADYQNPNIESEYIQHIDCDSDIATVFIEADSEYEFSWVSLNNSIELDQSSLSLTVTEPGDYELILINPVNGCQSNYTYSIESNLTPPDVKIIGNTIITCDNIEVLLSSEENEVYDHTWFDPTGGVIATEAEVFLGQAGIYTLSVTDQTNGCVSMQQVEIIEDLEEPQIILMTKGDVDCTGEAATLELELQDNVNYTWSTMDGEIVEDFGNVILVNKSGEYRVFVEDNNTGCTNTEVFEVDYSVPPPTLEITGNLLYCQEESTTLCIDTDGTNIGWIIDGQMIASGACFDLNTSGEIEVIVENALGCVSSEIVVVTQFESPSIGIITSGILDCTNPSVLLEADYPNDQNQRTFLWKDVIGSIVSTDFTLEVTTPGIYQLEVVYGNVGCSDSMTIEVMQDDTTIPESQFTTKTDQLSVTFESQVGQILDSMVWDFGDGNTSNESNPNHTYTEAGYYNVCLTQVNKCGEFTNCEEILAAATLTFNVMTEHNPCYGDSIGAFVLDLSGGLPDYEVAWTGPDGFTSDQVNISNLIAGQYEVNIVDQGVEYITQTFTINQPNEITINADIQDETAGFANGSIVLDVDGGEGNIEYLWSNGGTENYIEGLVAGDYNVVVTDANDCSVEVMFTLLGIVSNTDEIAGVTLFDIYPNPASSTLHLNIALNKLESANLAITDIDGRIKQDFVIENNLFNKALLLDTYEDGLYFVRINTKDNVITKKLLIIK